MGSICRNCSNVTSLYSLPYCSKYKEKQDLKPGERKRMFRAVGVPAWVLWSGSLLWCGITGVATHKPHAHRPNRGSCMQYNLGYNANQLSLFLLLVCPFVLRVYISGQRIGCTCQSPSEQEANDTVYRKATNFGRRDLFCPSVVAGSRPSQALCTAASGSNTPARLPRADLYYKSSCFPFVIS